MADTDPNTTVETVLGPIKFDAVGDINQKTISIYEVDLAQQDWLFADQVEFTADQ